MANNSQEFETKPSSNKDLWLFLIVLDVVFLCVFGFFLYKHFSAQVFQAAPIAPVAQEVAPEVVEEVVAVTQTPAQEEPTPQEVVAEPMKIPAVEEVTPVAEPMPVEVSMAPQEETPSTTVKESIVVTPTSGKYRRVTFRWFEPAETVAIVSGFTNRKPQALKKVGDYWETTLSIAPGTYKFLYVVDGKNTLDPNAQEKDGRSVLVVE